MAVNFSVRFIIDETTQQRVIRLTDTSTGFTFGKSLFSVYYPDGSSRVKTDYDSPDIIIGGGSVDILPVLDINDNIITGEYRIVCTAIDDSDVEQDSVQKTFDFNFIKPSNGIINTSDVVIPEVKFKDINSYNTNGSFSGTIPRSVSTDFPSTSAASGNSINGGVNDQEIDVVLSGNYYEGAYTVTSEVDGTYTHDSNSWLTVYYKENFTKQFAIKKCPNQDQLIAKINLYRAAIEAYEDTNDTQYNTLNEQYDLAIALYSHIIARFNSSTADGSEGQLRQLLSILEPYEGSYTYQSGAISGFSLSTNLTNSFTLSDGTTTDTFLLGETMVVLSGNAGVDVTLTDNQFEFTPVYGTTANTIAQGNDARFHDAVSINTANGLSIAGQNLSLATATTSTSGAMSFTDKAKLDSIDYGAKTGTVTSVGLGMPSAFTVANSPITTSGTLLVTAAGTIAQYITGVGTLATLDTDAVTEGSNLYYTIARFDSAFASKDTDDLSEGTTNLYFTNARSRAAISVSGSLSYDSGSGVISYTTPSETDPIYTASSWYTTTNNATNWDIAYGWGDHSIAGYLTSYTETDPVFVAHVAYGITATNISNWNTAYGWGDHSTQGYLTSYTETDPIFSASAASGISSTDINNWTTAYNWGDHSLEGYLTSESDPVFIAHPSYGITSTKITNWDTAYGWGDHSTQGYATQTYVGTQIAALVDSAPTTLDTLNELAAALGDDPNFATTVTNSIATKVPLTRTLTINGVSYDLSADRSWTVSSMVYPSAGIAISTGTAWDTSQPTSRLLPSGGTQGQLIAKASATDYDFEFIDNFAPQIMHLVKLGAAMTVGTAVYVSSADGTNMIVSKASNASEGTSSKTLGLLASGGALNAHVYVVTEGLLDGLDTSLATAGDPVWLGTNGALLFGLSNKPVSPAHLVSLGVVTRVQQNNGEIFVKVQNGFELDELHDVLITSEANNEIIAYESSTGLWKNKTIATVLGYTPYDATNPNGYISSYTETDPIYTASSWYTTTNNSSDWDTAFGWGNHASAGYLTSYTETDPIYTASSWYTTTNNSTNWDTAYGWGDHSSAGYLTSYTETDPIFVAHPSYGITSTKISNWDTAYGWGNHASAGYVPSTRTLTINGTAYDLSANRSWTISAGAFALGDATDVTITTPSSGQLLQYNGTAWVNWTPNYITGNQTINLSGDATGSGTTSIAVTLANSGVTAASYGSSSSIPVITVDAKGRITSATTQAVNIVSTLAGLSDTTIGTLSSGQLLQYNGSAWVNWTPNYLTSYTETDPIYTASSWYTTTNNSSDWNTAYGWGNHASAGYLTAHPAVSAATSVNNSGGTVIQDLTFDSFGHVTGQVSYNLDGRYYTETEIGNFFSGTTAITGYNKSNWDTAYGWGNHASAGYVTSTGSVNYATSAGNADTVDGYHVSTTRNAASTIPVRDASGYLQLGWINTTSGATTQTINKIYASTDDYIRYVTPATLISQLGLITTSTIGSQSVSYATSAGDADTVDSVHASSFLRNDTDNVISNTGVEVSFYSNDLGESTSGDQATLEVYQDTSGADAFMQFHISGDYAVYFGLAGDWNDLFVGGWSMGANRYRIWHQGNDGSGSGLDADLLDGNQASAFYLASNPSGYTTYSANQAVDTSSSPSFVDLYIDDQIFSTGDTNTYMQFHAADQWRVVTGGVERLEVNNSAVTVTGNMTVTGTITESSSIRYKENIVDLHNSLDKVLNMRGVAYNKKGNSEIELGVIAEEVADIVPEIINFNKDGVPDSVQYTRLTALLIEAIKEQQKKIEKLESLINK